MVTRYPIYQHRGGECLDCKLCIYRTQQMQSVLRVGSKIMLVAEAPTIQDINFGIPLSGEIGKVVDAGLSEVGLSREQCSVTNVVSCSPPHKRDIEKDELKACHKRLFREIREVSPEVIVPMGKCAVQSIYGKKAAITKVNGSILECSEFPSAKIVPCVHPGFIMRDPSRFYMLVKALKVAGKLVGGKYTETVTGTYTQLTSKEQAIDMFRALAKADAFAFDIEYDSVDHKPHLGTILCCSFCITSREGWWITWDNLIRWCGSLFKALMRSKSKVKVVHNAQCELKWMRYFGYPMSLPIYDTMGAAYLLDESEKSYSMEHVGLKKLALQHTDMGDYASDIAGFITTDVASFKEVPIARLGEYCAQDADCTIRLYNKFTKEVEAAGMSGLYRQLLMPSCELLSRVELHGALINPKQFMAVDKDLTEKIDSLSKEMQPWLKGRNPKSSLQLPDALVEAGCVLTKKTAKGNWCTDKDVIAELALTHNFLKPFIEFKQYSTLRSTFIRGLQKKVDDDQRLRTNYSMWFTDTGRLASRGPNLQNIPRNPVIRDLFIAPKGYSIVQVDFSQAELRWLAVHTQDPKLIATFCNESLDIHTATASECLGVSYDAVTKEERVLAKAVNFGIIYGRGAKAVALAIGRSIEEAQQFMSDWFARYHYVKEWQRKTIRDGVENGYVESFFGRRRRLPALRSNDDWVRMEAERQAINAPIQVDASDLTLIGSLRADRVIAASEFAPRNTANTLEFLTVHDSAAWYVIVGKELVFKELIKPAMSGSMHLCVPFKVDFEFGKSWGSLKSEEDFVNGVT